VVESKVEGKEILAADAQVQRTQVIDIMEALKQSLEGRAAKDGKADKKPAQKAKRAPAVVKEKKAAAR
jgi:non-homologous end joining protein Ku